MAPARCLKRASIELHKGLANSAGGYIPNDGQATFWEAENMSEKAKGKMKEAAGAVTGDEGKKAEGQAQQRKEAAREDREQQKRTQAEQNKADRAEASRDKQQRKSQGGLLGGKDKGGGLLNL
jgi:uncharacterized protein YjbJ (UPF0337 family)